MFILLRYIGPLCRSFDFKSNLNRDIFIFHTENNELNTAVTDNASTNKLSTEIDAGVSELCCVDVEVTCLVCSVVHWRHAESRLIPRVDTVAGVNDIVSTFVSVAVV